MVIDSYYYGKLVVTPLNIVLYNVFTPHGPDLYGKAIMKFGEWLGDSVMCLSFSSLIQLPHVIKYSISLLVIFLFKNKQHLNGAQ